jgi:hypothetical protein
MSVQSSTRFASLEDRSSAFTCVRFKRIKTGKHLLSSHDRNVGLVAEKAIQARSEKQSGFAGHVAGLQQISGVSEIAATKLLRQEEVFGAKSISVNEQPCACVSLINDVGSNKRFCASRGTIRFLPGPMPSA